MSLDERFIIERFIMNKEINIAKDFSPNPASRYRTDWDFSWEAFYEDILEKKFDSLTNDWKLIINLDGWWGYWTSFLSESFWRLFLHAKGKGIDMWWKIDFISNEDPMLIDLIHKLVDKFNVEHKN